jgi:hypothetical protein
MSTTPLPSSSEQPVWRRHLRKLVALAILLAGLGWVVSRHLDRPARHRVDLQVRISPEVFGGGGELMMFIDDARGETVWTFRGRLSDPIRAFGPLLVPGRYEAVTEWRSDEEKRFTVKVQFASPGPDVKIQIPGS